MAKTSCTTTGINCHDYEIIRTQKDAEPNAASEGKRYLPASHSTKTGMVCSSPVSMGPVKKVDQGQSDRKGDVCKSSLDQIANATPLANRFKNTEGRGA